MEFMQLLPSEVIKNAPSQQQFLHIISLYEDDLPSSRAFGTELDLWVSKWKDSEPTLARELDTPVKVIRLIDRDYYPNILKIITTLPVTSCECERSISMLKLLKTSLRSTMGQLMMLKKLIINIVTMLFMSVGLIAG